MLDDKFAKLLAVTLDVDEDVADETEAFVVLGVILLPEFCTDWSTMPVD
jgi:hypothetical protein